MSSTQHPKVPKYWRLAKQFRDQVEQGVLKPGDRLPSFAEMRDQHGVSRPTMEKVHAMLEQDGLIVREPGRGTFVAEPRQQAIQGVIGFVGIPFNAGQHPYGAHLLEGVQEVTHRAGLEILLLSRASVIQWEKVDGVLMRTMDPAVDIGGLPPGMPCVSLLVPIEGVTSVVADDYQGAKEATEHLLSLGHRRIAYITAATDPLSSRRVAGYLDALAEARVPLDRRWLRQITPQEMRVGNEYWLRQITPQEMRTGEQTKSGTVFTHVGREVTRKWLRHDWEDLKCTALLAQNDETAIGAIEAFREAGIRVPEDVSVVGFDGTELSQYFSPPLTTVEVPLREIGLRGAEMLLQLMAPNSMGSDSKEKSIAVPTQLRVHGSTAPPNHDRA